jgi:hypothetical protein
MKYLDLPAPQTLSARYLIPLRAPMSEAAIRKRISKAVRAKLTGPLRDMTLRWIGEGMVDIRVIGSRT